MKEFLRSVMKDKNDSFLYNMKGSENPNNKRRSLELEISSENYNKL